jgi:hypothetical protein
MFWLSLQHHLNDFYLAIQINYVPMIRGLLNSLVPGYYPSDKLVYWVRMAEQLKA